MRCQKGREIYQLLEGTRYNIISLRKEFRLPVVVIVSWLYGGHCKGWISHFECKDCNEKQIVQYADLWKEHVRRLDCFHENLPSKGKEDEHWKCHSWGHWIMRQIRNWSKDSYVKGSIQVQCLIKANTNVNKRLARSLAKSKRVSCDTTVIVKWFYCFHLGQS